MIDEIEAFWYEFNEHAQRAASHRSMLFRGVANTAYELVPSLGRNTYDGLSGDATSFERDLLAEFKRLAAPVLDLPPQEEFAWLFLAQHYGLPTRLLDWSTNPLVALFFAVEKADDVDAGLYVLEHMITDQYTLFDYRTADVSNAARESSPVLKIFSLQPGQGNLIFVRPRYTDRRYLNQKSVFCCPADPFTPFNHQSLRKLEIRSGWKASIRARLAVLGITYSFIFPDLAGVCSEVKALLFDPVAAGRLKIITSTISVPTSPGT